MIDNEPIKTAVKRPLRAAAIIIAHLLLGAVVTLTIWATEWLFHALWREQEPTFFGWLPVKWFFDVSELGVLIVFVFWDIIEANEKLRR